MKFVSLNKNSPPISFEESLFVGLAPDGGLYVPDKIPKFTQEELKRIPHMTLVEMATLTLHKWLQDEISIEELQKIVTGALAFPIPFVEVGGHQVLELFHGPTLSFKDFSVRILIPLMERYAKRQKKPLRFLLSSSGDTGSAVAHACAQLEDVHTVVILPRQGESILKRDQLLRAGKRVTVVEVDGNYDDCRELVKAAFTDPEIVQMGIISPNSISIAHLIPQIIYFVYVYALLYPRLGTVVNSSVDFGNAYVALMARHMGILFEDIVLACNSNHPAYRYMKKGSYKEFIEPSPSKPHRNPGNFKRVLDLCDYSHETFCDNFKVVEISDTKIPLMIQVAAHEYNYIIDFETAKAWLAADTIDTQNRKVVILSKLSPIKYAKEIMSGAGVRVDDRVFVESLLKTKPSKAISIPNEYESLKRVIKKVFP